MAEAESLIQELSRENEALRACLTLGREEQANVAARLTELSTGCEERCDEQDESQMEVASAEGKALLQARLDEIEA